MILSRNAVNLIKRFCRESPTERLGYQKDGIIDIKKHKWFQVTFTITRPKVSRCSRGQDSQDLHSLQN